MLDKDVHKTDAALIQNCDVPQHILRDEMAASGQCRQCNFKLMPIGHVVTL